MGIYFKTMAVLCFTFALSACSLLGLGPAKTPPVATYALSSVGTYKANTHSQQTIMVASMTASPGYQTTDMIYVTHRYHLSPFSHHRWIAPPADMLMPLLIQSLRETGYFHAVVSATFTGTTDLQLNTHLVKLEQEEHGEFSEVKLVIDVILVNNTTSEVIATKRFEAVCETRHNTPYGGVIAANEATEIILSEIAEFVVKKANSP